MCSKTLSILLLVTLLATAACMPQATSSVPTAASTPIPTTQAPPSTIVPAASDPTSVPNLAAAGSKTLTVLAAASLTESFTELGKIFETQNPGVKASFSFAGSQQLAQQLGQGADADVFASANKKYMDVRSTQNV